MKIEAHKSDRPPSKFMMTSPSRLLRLFWFVYALLFSLTSHDMTPQTAHAKLALGVQFGEGLGLSAQLELTQRQALNASLSYDISEGWLVAGVAHRTLLKPLKQDQASLYWGVGALGTLNARHEAPLSELLTVSLQVPLGIEARYTSYDIRPFAELGPTLSLLPHTELGLMSHVGVRVRFF